jgi:hypothetical protein
MALKGEAPKAVEVDQGLSEEQEMGKMLMTRKMKNLYQRMQFGLKKKRSKLEKIKANAAQEEEAS